MKNRLLTLALSLIGVTAMAGEIIPKPVKQEVEEGAFTISRTTVLSADENYRDIAAFLSDYLTPSLVVPLEVATTPADSNYLRLTVEPMDGIPADGYKIIVGESGIELKAVDRGGLFYAVQTLLQLLPADVYARQSVSLEVPCQNIVDYPAMGYRGFSLDVARTFSTKEAVMRFIDNMSRHKLNRLHWHIVDDEGWRIEIKAYPELAQTGGFRGGDSPVKPIYGMWDQKYGGYYTHDEIREVVAYAAFRNIEVIPEIDLPGHSRAVAKVFPEILCAGPANTAASGDDRRNVWCVAKESNYGMLDTILTEVAGLFPSSHLNIGGDEVSYSQWGACPNCQKLMKEKGYTKSRQLEEYFVERLTAINEKNGKLSCVWDEAAESGKMTKKNRVHAWQDIDKTLKVTKMGYPTVVMPGPYFYIDMKQSPVEQGLAWAGIVEAKRLYSFNFKKLGFTAEHMKNVEGVEGAFWAELYLSNGHDYLDYMTYPRIAVLSEVAWTDENRRDWNDFYGRLTGSHLDRLTVLGLKYRQFTPVVDYKPGKIIVTKPFEAAEVRYTMDGSLPTLESPLYNDTISDTEIERYLFTAFYNGTASTATVPSAKSHHKIGAYETKTFTISLPQTIDRNGLWYLRVRADDRDMKIMKIAVRYGTETSTIIGSPQNLNEQHQMRFYANTNNRKGKMTITMKNNNRFPCDLRFEFERLQYIEPKVTVTGTMPENPKFAFSKAADYNYSTYSRTSRTCKKGDSVTYTFAQPVKAYSIDIATGLSYLPRYNVTVGHVEVSPDGINFVNAGELANGKATLFPEGPIKAIRIVSDIDGNSENAVAIQDLKIKPLR